MQSEAKLVVVFGASTGIGESVAKKCHKKGFFVLSTGRREKVIENLESDGPVHIYWQHNVIEECDFEAFLDRVEKYFGRPVDVVIFTAGVFPKVGSILKPISKDDPIVTVNFIAAHNATVGAISYFTKKNRPGVFIHTSSVFGLNPAPAAPTYAFTKAGTNNMVASFSTLARNYPNIRCCCVAPGFVKTDMTKAEEPFLEQLGKFVDMDICVDAYLDIIEDDNKKGDILIVKPDGTTIAPTAQDPYIIDLFAFSDMLAKNILSPPAVTDATGDSDPKEQQ